MKPFLTEFWVFYWFWYTTSLISNSCKSSKCFASNSVKVFSYILNNDFFSQIFFLDLFHDWCLQLYTANVVIHRLDFICPQHIWHIIWNTSDSPGYLAITRSTSLDRNQRHWPRWANEVRPQGLHVCFAVCCSWNLVTDHIDRYIKLYSHFVSYSTYVIQSCLDYD